MSGGLTAAGDDGGFVPCATCGALAAGPCARCRKPVCGDCCVLTTGSAAPWAICLVCERSGAGSLSRVWIVVLGWFIKPIAILCVVYLLLRWVLG